MLVLQSREPTTPTSSDIRLPVVASYDYGRAKHGRAINSSVGVGAMIGLRSSKILGYDSLAKKSRVCETEARNGTVLTVAGPGKNPQRLWS